MTHKITYFLLTIMFLMVTEGHDSNKVSLSKLYKNPETYNHKLIRISGLISHGFEQFTLTDPNCRGR